MLKSKIYYLPKWGEINNGNWTKTIGLCLGILLGNGILPFFKIIPDVKFYGLDA